MIMHPVPTPSFHLQDVHAPAAAVSAPAAATAPAAADEDDDAYDPLEAFMADIGQEVAKQEARKAADAAAADKGKQRKALACDDEYDPGVEYMQVRTAQGRTNRYAKKPLWQYHTTTCGMLTAVLEMGRH